MQHPSPDRTSRPQSDVELGLFNRNPEGIGFIALLREDFRTNGHDILAQGFWALAVHRFGNWRMRFRNPLLRRPLSLLYRILFKLVECLGGISLAYTVKVGRRVRIWHHGGMILGALEICDDVHIRQNVTMGVRRHGDPRWLKPILSRGSHVGAGAVIVGAVVIGENSLVGANVVVATDVPPDSLVRAPEPTIRPMRKDADRAANLALVTTGTH